MVLDKFDEQGNCTTCLLPGSGVVSDGVCMCLEEQEWKDRRRKAWNAR